MAAVESMDYAWKGNLPGMPEGGTERRRPAVRAVPGLRTTVSSAKPGIEFVMQPDGSARPTKGSIEPIAAA